MLPFATWYESSSNGTNSPWYEQSRVRIVQGTNSPEPMVMVNKADVYTV